MLKYPVLALLWFYKRVCSPLLPPACRYEPTCSVYMAIAVRHRGAIVGVWLGLRRLLRCHPLGSHGWDPVPGVDEALQRPHVTPGSPYATAEPDDAPSTAASPPEDARSTS